MCSGKGQYICKDHNEKGCVAGSWCPIIGDPKYHLVQKND
jgi:hypothetical protein